ncbi:histidine phosphatase family protein [Streptomyces sp. NPDC005805]|uniref:histidine phosphatase family protein n=1 Tax=Streptomyces sp. NPDC005805 TaxID=3157068 RepID=UPI0033EAB0C8
MMKAVRRLVLLRHAATAWNDERRLQGTADIPLSAIGATQAERVGDLFAHTGTALVLSSPQSRALATAEAIACSSGAPLEIHDALREVDIGDWQGLTVEEIAERYPHDFKKWCSGAEPRRRGGESEESVADRSAPAALKALHTLRPGATLVAVSHAGTLRAMLSRLLGLSPQQRHALGYLHNCHWSTLAVGETVHLVEHNVGALPPQSPRVPGNSGRSPVHRFSPQGKGT